MGELATLAELFTKSSISAEYFTLQDAELLPASSELVDTLVSYSSILRLSLCINTEYKVGG